MARAEVDDNWEHFPHRGDIGIRGFGATRAEAFENAARALTAVITDPAKVIPNETIRIDCVSSDDEVLLADWLNALIYEMGTRNMLFTDFHVKLNDGLLTAEVAGEAVDIARHEPAVEIKGATYTELKVFMDRDGRWVAQCIVDV